MKIEKSILGIAGEFAVAAELCRRNIYAQLTLGHQKRVDLLAMSRAGDFLRIEVKAKQGRTWANQKGLPPGDDFLVFVDFAGRDVTARPDFFILSADDWCALAKRHVEEYQEKHPKRKPYLDTENCPVHPDERTKDGKPYRGCSVRVSDIEAHREAWSKILARCPPVATVEPPEE